MNYKILSLYDEKRNLIQEARFKSFEWAVAELEAKDGIYYISDCNEEIQVNISNTEKRQIKRYNYNNYTITFLGNDTCSISNNITNTTFKYKDEENFIKKFEKHILILSNTKRIDLTNRIYKIEKKAILTLEQQMAIETALQALKETSDYAKEDYKIEINTIEKLLR